MSKYEINIKDKCFMFVIICLFVVGFCKRVKKNEKKNGGIKAFKDYCILLLCHCFCDKITK